MFIIFLGIIGLLGFLSQELGNHMLWRSSCGIRINKNPAITLPAVSLELHVDLGINENV